ncbi:sulfite exporter TauE/SafE [Pedobacter africanus]|uniref:Sulfite exporter TauE/SafE n=1 Tax=Pedobacter africanus TaxID=151894 RepID=A0ACC6KRC2_9SPHI|nr:sulfite exporter TauE/SafE family protein [Pedobacter africanus]MDR6781761.1 sulfite exporter TauE/SafE [Pedobacter africanus]
MSTEKLAFMIGLLGSIHCIGMCGPLAFAVPVQKRGWILLVTDKLLYQLGRIAAYCSLGLMIGLIGRQIWLAGFQQGISILSGILIVLAACSRLFKFSIFKNQAFLLGPFNRAFHYALKHKANHLIIGFINGFLPCGFVYLALAGALNTNGIQNAVSYMFWFGLGTLPLMFIATLGLGFTGTVFRRKINRIVPYLMLCIGIWFILRGMTLNIPYLSPANTNEISNCR